MHACMHVCMYVHTRMFACSFMCRHMCAYAQVHVCKYLKNTRRHTCFWTHIWVWIKTPCCRRAPPLLQTFVAGPLLQTLVADLCVQYCGRQGACRGGVCRRTPPSVSNLCYEMAAQACYKAYVFDSLSYTYTYSHIMYMYVYIYVYMYIYI